MPPVIPPDRRREFAGLFDEFRRTYLDTPRGRDHLARYDACRRTGTANYELVTQAADRGEDVTDLVLSRLLPHTDSEYHRTHGDWIHIAPAINKDIRSWYEGSGIATPEEWPERARLILAFVRRVVDHPDQLSDACAEFSASPLSKGFQCGLLTPILNAVRPDRFAIVNSKSVRALNRFADTGFGTSVAEYPETNEALREVAAELISASRGANGENSDPTTLFDVVAHWLVAIHDQGQRVGVDGEEAEGARNRYGLDRNSVQSATRVMEALYPDGAVRKRAVAHLAWAIGVANDVNPNAWSVTLYPRLARLNVGWVFTVDLKPDGVVLLVLTPRLTDPEREIVKAYALGGDYSSVAGAADFEIPVEALENMIEVLRPAQEALIRDVAGRARTAPERSSHSPGVLAYLRANGFDVPDPGFSDRGKGVGEAKPGNTSGEEDVPTPAPNEDYTIEEMSRATYLPEFRLRSWRDAISRKGQGIFFGPPGTGKTFIAERMARHLASGGNGVVELVQFHPAYAYEDFIQGIRPVSADGRLDYQLVPGRFMEFCREAAGRSGLSVLIIDEINRAHLSQVFGELMYLLEYRDKTAPLAGGGALRIPSTVRIIGTMNTADRSIALVDYALRRRFAFLQLDPDYEVLRRFQEARGTDVRGLIGVLRQLNGVIGNPHNAVGISFFLRDDLRDEIEAIWDSEIEPYLEEYFFDQPATVDQYRWPQVRARVLAQGPPG